MGVCCSSCFAERVVQVFVALVPRVLKLHGFCCSALAHPESPGPGSRLVGHLRPEFVLQCVFASVVPYHTVWQCTPLVLDAAGLRTSACLMLQASQLPSVADMCVLNQGVICPGLAASCLAALCSTHRRGCTLAGFSSCAQTHLCSDVMPASTHHNTCFNPSVLARTTVKHTPNTRDTGPDRLQGLLPTQTCCAATSWTASSQAAASPPPSHVHKWEGPKWPSSDRSNSQTNTSPVLHRTKAPDS
jgi:hypothetical protein